MQRALVVSIHDVAPITQARVERMLMQLAEFGVPQCSLLVVPDYHHLGRSLGDRAFAQWLHARQSEGHEIAIHGFYHERGRRTGETVREKLVTRIYTAEEGEFYDLDYEEALGLMRAAQVEFGAHGFHPVGFIAPAWLLGPEAQRAAIDAGFRYITTLRTVRDFVSGEEFPSQSLVYSTRSGWRRTASLAWNRLLFSRLRTNPLLRLGIHPPDIAYEPVWRQILSLVRQARHDRKPTTYQEWLSARSASHHPHSAMA